jgi:hypothetical protein
MSSHGDTATFSRVIIEIGEINNTCFVVMPFQPIYDRLYEKVIKPAIEDAGLECVRGDETYSRQNIIEDIWNSIKRSRIIIADLSGQNPNVMYEAGLAHAIGKSIVLITRDKSDVSFDLRPLRYIFYDVNEPDWGQFLRKQLTEVFALILSNPLLSVHLSGVHPETKLPPAPTMPYSGDFPSLPVVNLAGVWRGQWISIKLELKHEAVLTIPVNHGESFTASATVTYERDGKRTIVQETLAANLKGMVLNLVGVNYTYVERGDSRLYSLDSFLLKTNNGNLLEGKIILRHGERPIVFRREV